MDTFVKITHEQIKCGNIGMGLHLLDDIKNRLNERALSGSNFRIKSIVAKDHTWIDIEIGWTVNPTENIERDCGSYVHGLVDGILIWSGVDSI